AILDADKEGFLRSETSLIQTIGRAARNVNSKVILYADKITDSMRAAIDETERRRQIQMEYNEANGITPESVVRKIKAGIQAAAQAHQRARNAIQGNATEQVVTEEYLDRLEKEMLSAAEDMEFERAASLRDKLMAMREKVGETVQEDGESYQQPKGAKRGRKKGSRGSGRKIPRPKKG
ncbi:MAG: UvrB/UvrC motif-containing protein, partial [Planctomycetota bacterium]